MKSSCFDPLLVLLASTVVLQAKKTYVLIGHSGSGKSTLCNVLFNMNAEMHYIENYPFPTSDSIQRCTSSFMTVSNDQITLVDTLGYSDDSLDHKLGQHYQDALRAVTN
jgi:predicted GTPase